MDEEFNEFIHLNIITRKYATVFIVISTQVKRTTAFEQNILLIIFSSFSCPRRHGSRLTCNFRLGTTMMTTTTACRILQMLRSYPFLLLRLCNYKSTFSFHNIFVFYRRNALPFEPDFFKVSYSEILSINTAGMGSYLTSLSAGRYVKMFEYIVNK